MGAKISVDKMAYEIMSYLKEYGNIVDEVVQDAVETVAKDTRDGLRAASPKDSGEYAKGWSIKRSRSRRGYMSANVYNRNKPSLTHLLEKGHAKRGGGRVAGIPHISDAEDFAEYELNSLIRMGLEK